MCSLLQLCFVLLGHRRLTLRWFHPPPLCPRSSVAQRERLQESGCFGWVFLRQEDKLIYFFFLPFYISFQYKEPKMSLIGPFNRVREVEGAEI